MPSSILGSAALDVSTSCSKLKRNGAVSPASNTGSDSELTKYITLPAVCPSALLGRGVIDLVVEHSHAHHRGPIGGARHAKVGELDLSDPRHQHVGRVQVAVHQVERPTLGIRSGVNTSQGEERSLPSRCA